jgi:hypothetical protein
MPKASDRKKTALAGAEGRKIVEERKGLTEGLRLVGAAECALCAMAEDVDRGKALASWALCVAFVVGRRRSGVDVCGVHHDMMREAEKIVDRRKRLRAVQGGAS